MLDIPAEVSARRRMERNIGHEIFDDGDLQRQLGDFYRNIDSHFPDEKIVHVDSNRPQAEVAAEVEEEAVVREAVGDRAPGPHEANLFDLQAKYAEVKPLAEVLDYLRERN